MALPLLAAIAIGSLLIGAGTSYSAQKQASKSNRAQRRLANLQEARERALTASQARKARAAVISGAEASGAVGSSSAQGAVSSIGAQEAAGLNFLSQANALNQMSLSAQAKAGQYAAIGGVAASVFGAAGGFSSLFKGPGPSQPSSVPKAALYKPLGY